MENDKKWTQIFINNDIRRALIDGDEVYSYLREKYPNTAKMCPMFKYY